MARVQSFDTPPQRRTRGTVVRMVVMLLVIGLITGGVLFFRGFAAKKGAEYMAGMKNQPQVISTAKATKQSWQANLSAVGSLRAVNGTDMAFETAGIVDSLHFNSGDDVQAGQVLATLRPDDTAGRLDSLKAQESLAEITIARDERQFKAQAVAQATIDADNANLKNLKAQVAQQQALIDERTIRAPFAGHLGIRQIDLGQYVNPGTVVVTLQALDPIYIDFFLPQQSIQALKLHQAASVHIDAYPGRSFTGEISAINPKVDASNRNIQIRALLKNPKHELLPGMYGTVAIAASAPQEFVTVPQTAISFNPYGNTVFKVVDKDSQGASGLFVKQSFITTGEARGDQIQVLTGLVEGDAVVTSGQTKLHNDTPIKINNDVQPASDATPAPEDQ